MYLYEVNSAYEFEQTVRSLFPEQTQHRSSEYFYTLYTYLADEEVVNDVKEVLELYQEIPFEVVNDYITTELREEYLEGLSITAYVEQAQWAEWAIDEVIDLFLDHQEELGVALYGTAKENHFVARTYF